MFGLGGIVIHARDLEGTEEKRLLRRGALGGIAVVQPAQAGHPHPFDPGHPLGGGDDAAPLHRLAEAHPVGVKQAGSSVRPPAGAEHGVQRVAHMRPTNSATSSATMRAGPTSTSCPIRRLDRR